MSNENQGYVSNIGMLDSQLRSAEADLQQDGVESALNDAANANVGNLDKIRDILFGTQARDYEKRFKRLEERFSKDNMHLRDDMVQRLKSLEELVNSELESLSEKTKTERQERYAAIQDLQSEIAGVKTEINNRITQMDEQLDKDLKQLRQQMHNRFQELSTQLRQQNDTLQTLMKQEVAQLQEDKINRTDLAAFFTEFAVRLNRDFNSADQD